MPQETAGLLSSCQTNNMYSKLTSVLCLIITVCITSTHAQHRDSGLIHAAYPKPRTLAVLPLHYIGEGSDEKVKEMPYRLQDYTANFLSDPRNEFRLQDPLHTNAILQQNGITHENVRQFTPKELADLLHVDLLLTANVLQEVEGVRSVSNRHRRSSVERDDDRGNKRKRREYSHRSTATSQQYQTDVSVSIYDSLGYKIYSSSRQSVLSEMDAYKNALRYLLRRSPLFAR